MTSIERRRFLVPEIIQTSATDCGPAALEAVAEGMGLAVSYERLRTVCQTGIDGTSIDDLEEVAAALGLGAEQTMLPADHLLSPVGLRHPAIVVLRDPIGEAHFVVAWRRWAGRVQLMDPTSGRRWPSLEAFERELYVHEAEIPAQVWRDWALGPDFTAGVEQRMRVLGIDRDPRVRALWQRVREGAEHHPLATFDAALRLARALVGARAVRRGREAAALSCRVVEDVLAGRIDPGLLDAHWFARPVDAGEDGQARVRLRGAVLIRLGVQGDASEPTPEPDGDEATSPPARRGLAAHLHDPTPRASTLRTLLSLLGPQAQGRALALGALAVVLALGSIAEVVLLHGLLDLVDELALPLQRVSGTLALGGLVLALLVIERGTLRGVARLGRELEGRMRIELARKLPRMRLEYFRSRLPSDLATRSQRVHLLRGLPHLVRHVVLVVAQLVATATLLVWLDPLLLWPTLWSLGLAMTVALLVYPPLRERDLKLQSLDGNLSNAYLDAMLGLAPAQAHGAEPTLEREHQRLLGKWQRAGEALQRALATTEGLQALVGSVAAVWIITDHLGRAGHDVGGVILVVYLALSTSVLGVEMVQVLRVLPRARNVAQRQLEPLLAPEHPAGEASAAGRRAPGGGLAVAFESVSVALGGSTLLDDVSLELAAGAHVAVVGASGAGKSSLLSVLLGRHRPTRGRVTIDGEPLTEPRLWSLRERTAWVDPCVQLWNHSLLHNIVYGAEQREQRPLASILARTRLDGVLDRLAEGLQTPLGEEGRRLSGGEGQRARLARAWCREAPGLVLLDEPFRGLERELRDALLAEARRHWSDATMLYVTHDVSQALALDQVLVIDGGQVVERGDPRVLAQRPESAYARLLAAERALHDDAWSPARWRRLDVVGGRVASPRAEAGHA